MFIKEDISLTNVEVKNLFKFFLYCFQCSEEDIPCLVKEAEKMSAFFRN